MKVKIKVSKKIQNVIINTDYIKLDSFLKFCGEVQTGGSAKEEIINGEVSVNGEKCIHRGKKLFNGDIIEYNNKLFKVISNENK